MADERQLPPVLKAWYCVDTFGEMGGVPRLRADVLHWERVLADPKRFPDADVAGIQGFLDAAYPLLV